LRSHIILPCPTLFRSDTYSPHTQRFSPHNSHPPTTPKMNTFPYTTLFRSSPTKSSNLSETAEVPACNVPSRSPLPALAIAPETKLGTASSGLGTLEP